jgi:hypothetical protein
MPLPTLKANSISEDILPEIPKNDRAAVPDTPASTQDYDEPIVTRRELWSYYRMYNFLFSCSIINSFSSVYHFGNNVGFPPVGYPEHCLVLIFDACVRYVGTRTRG